MIFSATTWFVSRIHCVSSAVLRVRVLQALHVVYHETVQLYCPVQPNLTFKVPDTLREREPGRHSEVLASTT